MNRYLTYIGSLTTLLVTLQMQAQIHTSMYVERLHMETNSSFFIPGEEVLVAIHTTSENYDFHLSKVAYIELLGVGNNPVIQQKVQLKNGQANASIYLPSYLKSGNYHLIVYTKWSKNFQRTGYTSRVIAIINPFNTIPQSILLQHASYDSVRLNLFPEGGQFYANSSQKVGFQVVNELDERVPAFIEIRDGNDSLIFSTKNAMKGHFDFIPIPRTTYSVSLIDTLDRIFLSRFQLGELIMRPARIVETANHFEIKLTENSTAKSLQIAMNGKILEQEISESQVLINKADLPKGLMLVTLMNEKQQDIYHQSVFHEPEQIQLNCSLPAALKTGKTYQLDITSPEEMDVTITIRKKEPIASHENQVGAYYLANQLNHHNWPNLQVTPDELIFAERISNSLIEPPGYIPDYRGELISGILLDEKGKPVSDYDFFLTTEGSTHQIYPVTTNETGAFRVAINPTHDYKKLVFSIPSNLQIKLEDPFQKEITIPRPYRLLVDQLSLEEWLVPKSLQVQLDNLYQEVSIDSDPIKGLFETQAKVSYDLDDFTRFPSLSDPIQEYIPLLIMRKENGKTQFNLRNVENKTLDYPVLSTVDGIVCEPDAILSLDQGLIDRIEVYNRQFQLGTHFYSGAVNFLSYADASVSQPLSQHFKSVNQQGTIQLNRSMDQQHSAHQPAMHVQLVWEPHYMLTTGKNRIEFQTSDVPGIYEVKITGINPGSYVYELLEFEISADR